MKAKGKYKKFKRDYFNKREGEVTFGKFGKMYATKRTCRFQKHK